MIYLLVLFALLIVFTFFGYIFHRIFHQPWSGKFYESHMNHHIKQYPPEDFYSDKYRDAGKDNSVWLFAIAFSPLAAILILLVLAGYISFILGVMIAAEMAFIGWLNDNMHDSFHIKKTFWHKFTFFQKLIDLHYYHHVDMKTNFGIINFHWDKVFGSFKEYFCDYCTCEGCKFGEEYLHHAKTITEKWICDVCYDYEICQTFPEGKGNPCPINIKCNHRPKLKTDWIKFNK